MYKVLNHKRTNDKNATAEFFIYKLFAKIVNLTNNERSKGENDERRRSRQLLLNLMSINSTESD